MSSPDLKSSTELRGLALPATKGPGGYFESKSPGDTAWGDLLLALMTPLGGRFMRRNLGSTLYEQLFEPIVEGDFPLVDYTIRQATVRQLTNVRIVRTNVSEVQRGIEVAVFFRLSTDFDTEEQRLILVPKTFIGS
jgi:phage baseplate assembly protein W